MSDDVARTEIGPNSRVAGEIESAEDVVIFGRVEGTIHSKTSVIIEEGGLAKAEINAANVLVAGAVIGNISATERIEVAEKGRVLGDLYSPRLVIAAGGAVRGKVSMTGEPSIAEQMKGPGLQKGYAFKTAMSSPKKTTISSRKEIKPRTEGEDQ